VDGPVQRVSEETSEAAFEKVKHTGTAQVRLEIAQNCFDDSQATGAAMSDMYVSPHVTLFPAAHRSGMWFVGTVTALQGPRALRVQHECLPLRDTELEAYLDACDDAEKLLGMWGDRVQL
jgi:hypothetical protein